MINILRNYKILSVVILVTLVGTGFIIWHSIRKKPVPVVVSKAEKPKDNISQEGLKNNIEQEVYTFKVEGFNKEKKVQWGLEGESATVVRDKININNLRAVYYGGDTTLTLFADNAVYDKKTQDIELKTHIVGRSSDGGELITDYARWDANTEEIKTDSSVVIKRQNIITKGKGLIAKPQLKHLALQKEIEVYFIPDKKITCNGPLEIDHEKNVAIFNNSVKVVDKDSEMFTDKLTAFLNPDTHEIEKIVTEGDVEIVHRGDIEDIGGVDDISF